MSQEIIWSARANASAIRLALWLQENVSAEYSLRYMSGLHRKIAGIAEHPTKGIPTGKRIDTRRLPLDKHNYVIYQIIDRGIVVHNIGSYKANKRGF